jgi:hypothetical protein
MHHHTDHQLHWPALSSLLTYGTSCLILKAGKKRIGESDIFKVLVFECLIQHSAAVTLVQIGAWAAIIMALLAWLVPRYCIVSVLGVNLAKSVAVAQWRCWPWPGYILLVLDAGGRI